ncbi:hypothetical protein VAE151_580043 [Vibrio aestuarianus]|uniref:Uncharacterized protein n=1 Tax=Vibrio aestuarianus TaxID=28171 RepID=A0ABM9FU45_9VIBR|nr:hypothetical protein VAE308_1080044 [Vibrio aestuarianus]CAH8215040.1 hypothetical protein VIBAE_A40166 [Vibrio aestuarianus subsp. francensis]CAH8216234.1 hypothetical protein VAE055_400044 [Vibrio aestuarianus]CAH8216383.1 hypothetical protein VAE032_300044 [Vibrio aestuarianus]CAH8216511.1 hypothetical protein VAE128_480044 [Vibrio aestuarianus]
MGTAFFVFSKREIILCIRFHGAQTAAYLSASAWPVIPRALALDEQLGSMTQPLSQLK